MLQRTVEVDHTTGRLCNAARRLQPERGKSLADMSVNLFTYGSLMFPEVWTRVVSAAGAGSAPPTPARVEGYARFAVAGQTYPGLVAQGGGAVRGMVYFDLGDADMAALDAFEGPDYQRIKLPAILDSGEIVPVHTYLFRDPAGLSDLPWPPEEFRLQTFLETYCAGRIP